MQQPPPREVGSGAFDGVRRGHVNGDAPAQTLGQQVVHQRALADAGIAIDEHNGAFAAMNQGVETCRQNAPLGCAADDVALEHGAKGAGANPHAGRSIGHHRAVATLQGQGNDFREFDQARRAILRAGITQNRILRGLHEARGKIYRIAHDGVFPARLAANDAAVDATGGYADGTLDVDRAKGGLDVHRRFYTAQRIVFVRQRWQAERCEHRNAFVVDGEFVDAAFEAVTRFLQGTHGFLSDLDVGVVGELRQVDEENRQPAQFAEKTAVAHAQTFEHRAGQVLTQTRAVFCAHRVQFARGEVLVDMANAVQSLGVTVQRHTGGACGGVRQQVAPQPIRDADLTGLHRPAHIVNIHEWRAGQGELPTIEDATHMKHRERAGGHRHAQRQRYAVHLKAVALPLNVQCALRCPPARFHQR